MKSDGPASFYHFQYLILVNPTFSNMRQHTPAFLTEHMELSMLFFCFANHVLKSFLPFYFISVSSEEVTFNLVLVCHGLDTVADVFINDNKVGSSDNMFVRYSFKINPYVHVSWSNIQYLLSAIDFKYLFEIF